MKIGELLRQAAAGLREGGIDEFQLEAELLLRGCLGLSRVELHLGEREMTVAERERFADLLARRLRREPLAYILGEKEFWSLPFLVTPAVLIPRPETESLIEEVLARIHEPAGFAGTILDLGTGSGIIPVVLARELPRANLVGVDRSSDALVVAVENGRRHGVAGRVAWLVSDWFGGIAPAGGFSFIVTNPPYVAEAVRASLQPELTSEPPTALFAGEDGLDDIKRLVGQAPAYLETGGWLIMEIGYDQGRAVEELLGAQPAFGSFRIVKDYAGLDRLAVARKL